MNWGDLLVIGIIAGFGIIGLFNGFIISIYKLAAFLISLIISIKLYPVVANMLIKTDLYTNIKSSIFNSLLKQQQTQGPGVGGEVKKAAADTVVNNLHLPGFLKNTLLGNIPNPSKLIDLRSIIDTISGELAKVVIDVISLILIYILIRIGLIFLKFLLTGIAKLPVFKQVDKLGGFAFGALEGLLTIYIICAVIMLFHSAPQFKGVFEAIDNSTFAKFFYQNNFIVDWMFPPNKVI